MKILWSEFASEQLNEIFHYYSHKASPAVAKRLIENIINAPIILSDAPNLGILEPSLRQRKNEYRFLIFNNYKIIYYVDTIGKRIMIADVFDTRQDPAKIKRSK